MEHRMPPGSYLPLLIGDERKDLERAWQIAEATVELGGGHSHTQTASIAYIPVDPRLTFSGVFSSVAEEVFALASYHGRDARSILSVLGADDFAQRLPTEMSGGQLVISAIALGTASKPAVWVLDRCFEWLDPQRAFTIREFLNQEMRGGASIIELSARGAWLLQDSSQPPGRPVGAPDIESSHVQSKGPVLTVVGLQASFKGFTLGPLDLTVRAGERIAVLGPNGAGKTTLAKALVGLVPTEGTTFSLGQSSKKLHAILSFQNPDDQLFRPTVRQELTEAAKRSGGLNERRLDTLSECLGIGAILSQDPLGLPLSQRRLVAIAGALVADVPLAILDEPTAFLAPAQVASVLRAAQYAAGTGTAVMAITHDEAFADSFAERSIYLRDGQLICDRSRARRNSLIP